MKSIYLRNFATTALLVTVCFLLISVAFVGIGRQYMISEYQDKMESCVEEVSRIASAVSRSEGLSGWTLSMNLSALSNSTGNHIFVTDADGLIVSCSDRAMRCDFNWGRSANEYIKLYKELLKN